MRIIAGAAGGRRLSTPRGARPTTDRVREALFSSLDAMLGGWEGLRVLDLYAGSGALGLEALSRGAADVVLVERDRASVSVLRGNVDAVGLPGARVVADDAEGFAARSAGTTYDLVLMDPPYAVDVETVRGIVGDLARTGSVATGAISVVERPSRDAAEPWPAGPWELVRRRDYGDTALWYGRFLGPRQAE